MVLHLLSSIAFIIIFGLLFGQIFEKFKLPTFLGMIIAGIFLGPGIMNLIDSSILNVSSDLREIALIIILMRAGLSLDIMDLKKIGRPAILMCFLPACFEILGAAILGPALLGISLIDSLIVGSVIAAVSPAIVVPRMIKLIENKYGKKHSIPQIILAGASVDDVFVIVVFTAFTSLASTGKFSLLGFIQIPIAIILGIVAGILLGYICVKIFKKNHMRDSVKISVLISIGFLLVELQNVLDGIIPFSGFLAIMSMGIFIKNKYEILASRLSLKYNKLWVVSEVFLFVLVGVTVDIHHPSLKGIFAILLVIGALMFRMVGVLVSLIKTKFEFREKLFCMISYTPKATVQAAIGSIPLAMGLACGHTVLTVAVVSILITAPFGAICIDKTYRKLLRRE